MENMNDLWIYDKNIAEDAFVKAMEGFDAIIVRCNPGQINAAGGRDVSLVEWLDGKTWWIFMWVCLKIGYIPNEIAI